MKSTSLVCAFALAAAPLASQARVVLAPGGASVDSDAMASFIVDHACQGSVATRALRVELPTGFRFIEAAPRIGWTIKVVKGFVTWTANNPAEAMPGSAPFNLRLRGHVNSAPGPLWFKVKQTCDASVENWNETRRNPSDQSAHPAPRLDVLPPGVAPVDVRNTWALAAAQGQRSFVISDLFAPSGSTLVGASSPVADDVRIHHYLSEGDLLRIRPPAHGLELPAGKTLSLALNGYHLLLDRLKTPLVASTTFPVTLRFVDAQGRESMRDIEVPVLADPPVATP